MLRKLALAAGVVGVGCIALAVVGRFVGTPLLGVFVTTVEAGTMLTLANNSFLIGIFLYSQWTSRLQSSMEDALQLGQYTLEEKLGEGGMGKVYKARHAMMRRPVAIKLMLSRAGSIDKEQSARFEREVVLTSQLTHPNTIAIYDYGCTPEGIFYYAMEHLEGLELGELVDMWGPLQEGRVIAIGSGRVLENGKVIAPQVKVGDTVLFSKYGGTEVDRGGDEYLIVPEADILAIIKK